MIDAHCHLNSLELINNIDSTIKEANKNGVNAFIVSGWDLESSKIAVKLAETYPNIYAAIGIHPCDSLKMGTNDLLKISELLKSKKVIAFGEIGLDFYWNKEDKEKELQKKNFILQIKLANDAKLPIIVHSRDANSETLNILKEYVPLYGGVMHCYSAGPGLLNEYLKLGMYISLGGPITFKNAKTPKEVAKIVPLERLLLETDSPYLSPEPFRGTTNTPKNVMYIYQEVALIKDVSKETIIQKINENFERLFHVKTNENKN